MLDDLKRRSKSHLAPNVLDLLRWVGSVPRTYGDTMEAWRTSCPKLPAWEDAIDNELVRVEPSEADTYLRASVQLTQLGFAMLDAATLVHGPAASVTATAAADPRPHHRMLRLRRSCARPMFDEYLRRLVERAASAWQKLVN